MFFFFAVAVFLLLSLSGKKASTLQRKAIPEPQKKGVLRLQLRFLQTFGEGQRKDCTLAFDLFVGLDS